MRIVALWCFFLFSVVVLGQGFPQNPAMTGGMGRQSGGFDSSEVSRDSARVMLFKSDVLHRRRILKQPLIKNLDGFHRHHPVFRSEAFNSSIGTIGQAIHPLSLNTLAPFGFHYGLQPYDAFALSHHDADYYEAQSPYTEAFFVTGSGQEQFFRLIHTQNVNANWNFGLHYQRVTSAGFFSNERTNHTAFRMFSSYFSDNKRYRMLFSASINDLRAQENGGITALGDTLFRDNIEQNRAILPVNLRGASNQSFQNGFVLGHHYQFTSDSSTFSLAAFQHLSYDYNRFSVEDNARPDDYYPIVFNPSMLSTDHYLRKWNQESGIKLGLTKQIQDSIPIYQLLRFSIGREWSDVYMKFPVFHVLMTEQGPFTNDTLVRNNYFSLSYDLNYNERIRLSSHYRQMISGANAGDFLFTNDLNWDINRRFAMDASLHLQNREQFYFFNHFSGNHSYWLNDFRKSQQFIAQIGVLIKSWGLRIGLSQTTINNPVVLDVNALPVQLAGAMSVSALHLQWRNNWRRFFFERDYVAQFISGEDAIRLPNFYGRYGIYYKTYFKSKTEIRVGVDAFLIYGFTPMRYVPHLGQFALQNDFDSPIIYTGDIYLSANIKRARFFARLEHFNEGIIAPYNYIVSPGYPLSDRVFRIGLSWMFFD